MECGRSFVEMLGTLALMGILSVVGILGYTHLVDEHKANEILQAVNLRATLYATQNHNHPLSILSEFQPSENIGGVEIKNTVFEDALNNRFAILTENVPPKICTQVLNKMNQKNPLRMITSYSENALGNKINSGEECVENLAFVFNNDLESNDLSICSDQQQRINGECCDADKVCGQVCCGENMPLCNSATYQCEGCISDDDCINQEGDKIYCNTTTHTCEKPYIELEYIESTGTQYIDTGFKPTQETDTEMTALITREYNPNASTTFFGVSDGSYDNNAYTTSTYQYGAYGWDGNGNRGWGTYHFNINELYSVRLNKKAFYVNNEVVDAISPSYVKTPQINNLTLLAANYCGATEFGVNKVYSCKIWDNNTLVRDFIPAKRKSDNVLGMWDKVERKFYTNQGSGAFIAGPEVE